MKSTPFLDYILYDIFGENEPITTRAMMGAYILYYEGKAFAIVEKEELYFKGSQELATWYIERGSKQFTYTKEGEDAHLNYFLVPPEIYEHREDLEVWLHTALSVAVLPKKSTQNVKNKKVHR
jgi:TfoX/Sxy family transcriptional regulator of competence genes